MARTSFTLVALAIAGMIALALGILGIYGVILLCRFAAHPLDRYPHGAGREEECAGVDVRSLDPVTFTVVPVILVAAAALASYLPARRSSAVNPVEALRAE